MSGNEINLQLEEIKVKTETLFSIFNIVKEKFKDIKYVVDDVIYLLNSIKNDRYQTIGGIGEENHLDFAYVELCQILKIWFYNVWFPKIRENVNKISQIANDLNHYNISQEDCNIFKFNQFSVFLEDNAIFISQEIEDFSKFIEVETVMPYETIDYIVNFPFFGDLYKFLKSLVIFPYKVSYGNSYALLRKFDRKIDNFIDKLNAYNKNIDKKIALTFLQISNYISELNEKDFEDWKNHDFSQVISVIYDDFIQILQNLEIMPSYLKITINDLENKILNEEDFVMVENQLSLGLKKLENYVVTNIDYLNEVKDNWKLNLSEKFCSENKKQLIKKFEKKFNETLSNISLNFEIIVNELSNLEKFQNFKVNRANLVSVANQNEFINRSIDKMKPKINFFKKNYPSHGLFFYPFFYPNVTSLYETFDYKLWKKWITTDIVILEICRLSKNELENSTNWKYFHFPEFLFLLDGKFNENYELLFYDIKNFFSKDEINLSDTTENLKKSLKNWNKRIFNKILNNIADLYKLKDKWDNKKTLDYCTPEEKSIIMDVDKKIQKKLIYLVNNYRAIESILEEFEKKLDCTINNALNEIEISSKLEFILAFLQNLKYEFIKYETISKVADITVNSNKKIDYENLVEWNNNNQILGICNLNTVGFNKLYLDRKFLTFINKNHLKEITIWNKHYFPKILKIIDNNFNQILQNLTTSFWLVSNNLNFYADPEDFGDQTIFSNLINTFETFIANFNNNINYFSNNWINWKNKTSLKKCFKPQTEIVNLESSNIYQKSSYLYKIFKNANNKFKVLRNKLVVASESNEISQGAMIINETVEYIQLARDKMITIKDTLLVNNPASKITDEIPETNNIGIKSLEKIVKWNNNHEELELCDMEGVFLDKFDDTLNPKDVFAITYPFANEDDFSAWDDENWDLKEIAETLEVKKNIDSHRFNPENFTRNDTFNLFGDINITPHIIGFLLLINIFMFFILRKPLFGCTKSKCTKKKEKINSQKNQKTKKEKKKKTKMRIETIEKTLHEEQEDLVLSEEQNNFSPLVTENQSCCVIELAAIDDLNEEETVFI